MMTRHANWCQQRVGPRGCGCHYNNNLGPTNAELAVEVAGYHPARALTLQQAEEKSNLPDFRRDFIVSPSQFETAFSCKRKWWLQKVKRLPSLRRVPDPRTFGDVLHSVLERYYKSDELGRDANGKPLLLYPKGWHKTVSAFGVDKGQERSVGVADQALIRALVDKAIEGGIIQKIPESMCEIPFTRELRGDLGESTRPRTWITGSIDYATPTQIEDHKSSKAKKWLKSPAKIQKSIQMLCYGRELLQIYEDKGLPLPDAITFAHNGFVKDPENPLVKKTETKEPVSRERIESFWTAKILPMAAALHDIKYKQKPKDWNDVTGAEPGSKACEQYGGCEFIPICSGREEPEAYKKRIQHQNSVSSGCPRAAVVSSIPQTQQKGTNMDFAAKLAARMNRPGSSAAVAAPPKPKPTPKPKPRSTAKAPSSAPPWAQGSCNACKNNPGFNSKGNPCRICCMHHKQATGEDVASEFSFVAEEGIIFWSSSTVSGETKFVGEIKVQEPAAPAPKPEPIQEPAQEPAAAEDTPPEPIQEPIQEPIPPTEEPPEGHGAAPPTPAPAKPKAKAKGKRGRPKGGFTLLIDCAPLSTKKDVVLLSTVLAGVGEIAIKEAGVDSYYQLDCFKRRDAMCAALEIMDFGTKMVIATTNSVDEREVLKVLKAKAEVVFVGAR